MNELSNKNDNLIPSAHELEKMIQSHVYDNNHKHKYLLKKYIMYLNVISTSIYNNTINNKIDKQIDCKINDSYSLYEYLYPLIITQLENILNNVSEKDSDIYYFILGGSSINSILNKFHKLYDISEIEIIPTKDIDIRSMVLYKNNSIEDRKRCYDYNIFVGKQMLLYLENILKNQPQFKFEFVVEEFNPTTCNVIKIMITTPHETFSLIDFCVQYDDNKPLDTIERAYTVFDGLNDFDDLFNSMMNKNNKNKIIMSGLGFEIFVTFYLLKKSEDQIIFINNEINTIYKDYDTFANIFGNNNTTDESFKNVYHGYKEYYNIELVQITNKMKKYIEKINNMFKLISFIKNTKNEELNAINTYFEQIYNKIF